MARRARLLLPGEMHYVLAQAAGSNELFQSDADYRYYAHVLHDTASAADVKIRAYALLPRAVHLLVEPASIEAFRAVMRLTHASYSRYARRTRCPTRAVWKDRPETCVVERSLASLVAFWIENAPVRENRVAVSRAWRWSSAAARTGARPTDLLLGAEDIGTSSADAWARLGERADRCFAFRLERSLRSGLPLGDSDFAVKVVRFTAAGRGCGTARTCRFWQSKR